MLPHEKAIAAHQRALEKVYQSVERKNPRGWVGVKKFSSFSQNTRYAFLMFSLIAVGMILGLPFFYVHLQGGLAMTMIGAFVGMFGGALVVERLDEALLGLGKIPASPEKIKTMSQGLSQYPRLKTVLEKWLLKNGGTIVNRRQEALLSKAIEKLEALDLEESNRLEGLAIIEEQHGLVGQAQSTTRGHHLEKVLGVAQSASVPKVRM